MALHKHQQLSERGVFAQIKTEDRVLLMREFFLVFITDSKNIC
jgi:hypothetical protein